MQEQQPDFSDWPNDFDLRASLEEQQELVPAESWYPAANEAKVQRLDSSNKTDCSKKQIGSL
mgnify:CR=1 FL=1